MHTFHFVGFFLAYVIEKAELGGQSYLVTSKSVRLRGIGGVWDFFSKSQDGINPVYCSQFNAFHMSRSSGSLCNVGVCYL